MSRTHKATKREIADARDVVQTVILHKFAFPSRAKAVERAIRDGFDVRDIDEKPETWHFRQRDPARFRSLHSFPFAFGITVVLGHGSGQ